MSPCTPNCHHLLLLLGCGQGRQPAACNTRFALCAGHFDEAIALIHIKDMPAQLDEPESSLGPSLVLGLCLSVASMVVLLPAFAADLGGQPIGSDSAGHVGGNG